MASIGIRTIKNKYNCASFSCQMVLSHQCSFIQVRKSQINENFIDNFYFTILLSFRLLNIHNQQVLSSTDYLLSLGLVWLCSAVHGVERHLAVIHRTIRKMFVCLNQWNMIIFSSYVDAVIFALFFSLTVAN